MTITPLIGRILFAIPLIIFGVGHLADAQMMVDNGMVPSFLPAPTIVVYLTGILLILCGGAIAVGFETKTAAMILALFLASTTIMVWAFQLSTSTPDTEAAIFGNFMKDMSLTGAALIIAYFGAGPVSMDERATE